MFLSVIFSSFIFIQACVLASSYNLRLEDCAKVWQAAEVACNFSLILVCAYSITVTNNDNRNL